MATLLVSLSSLGLCAPSARLMAPPRPASRVRVPRMCDDAPLAPDGSRRRLLSLSLLPLVLSRPAGALPATLPTVEILSTPDICQARTRDQDFLVVRYTGRFADGRPFDERYAQQPLTFELGGFYLPGVDQALTGLCVGTRVRLAWARSPALGPEFEPVLPAGSAIEMDVSLVSIKYSLFGEKMRIFGPGAKAEGEDFWFAPKPLTLSSPVDARGHRTDRETVVKKDNPFSIAPGENSIISNPANTLRPLYDVADGLSALFGGGKD